MKYFKTPEGLVIAFCFVLPLLLGPEVAAKVTAPSTPLPTALLEVKVHGVIVDPSTMQPVVLLADPSGSMVMPIWIGPNEAAAIQGELEGTRPPRPTSYDLLERLIQRINGTMQRIIITQEKGGIYYAVIVLEKDRMPLELDARPSDSIVMALKCRAPILIPRNLFREKAVLLQGQESVEAAYGLTAQELTLPLAESFQFKKGKGVLIADVKEGSQAEKDGFQGGDVLVDIGEQAVEDLAALRRVLTKMKGPLKVTLFRGGNYITLILNPPL